MDVNIDPVIDDVETLQIWENLLIQKCNTHFLKVFAVIHFFSLIGTDP
jgi:hypothetical protein